MKKGKKYTALLLSAVMILGSFSFPARAENTEKAADDTDAITEEDFLKAAGREVRADSGKGEVVQLKGSNAGGFLVQEPWMSTLKVANGVVAEMEMYKVLTERFGEEKMRNIVNTYQKGYWTEADFDHCKALGMNCVRLPFWFMNLVDFEGNLLDDAFDRIDWFVEEAGKRGLYVILDMHGAPGSQNGSDHSGIDGGNQKQQKSEFFFGEHAENNQELFYELWEKIAEHYKGNPVVAGYDLMNEPYCTYRYNTSYSDSYLHTMLWDIYDEAYGRIRKIDPDHMIIMEATWNPSDLPDPYQYGWENVMYQYHQYEYSDYNNDAGRQISGIRNKVNSILNAGYNVPSYIGEFCLMTSPDAWKEGLELLNNAGISWTTWTFKGIRTSVTEGQNWCQYFIDNGEKVDVTTASYEDLINRWTDNGTSTQNVREGFQEVMKAAFEKEAQEAPEKGEEIQTRDGGVDLEKYDGRLEGEFCRPTSGDFSSYNVSTGSEEENGDNVGYVQWDAKDWGNAKWIAYFRQAGTYEVKARMKVTQSGGSNFKFGVGTAITGDGSTKTTVNTAVTEGYQDVVIGDVTVSETGLHGIKIMDGYGDGNAKAKLKLDYLQFTLKKADGEHDDSEDVKLQKVELNVSEKTLEEGQSFKLTKKVTPSSLQNSTFYWNTSDRSVATVSAGTVKAVRPGKAVITVRAKDDPQHIRAVCEVTVTAKIVESESESESQSESETTHETESSNETETKHETESQNESTRPSESIKPTESTKPTASQQESNQTQNSETQQNTVKTAKVKGVRVKRQKNGKVKISFKAVRQANGYEIYRSAKKKKAYRKICSLGKRSRSYTDKKVKKTCYYKVRAYRRINGKKKYGAFSQPVKCSIRSR